MFLTWFDGVVAGMRRSRAFVLEELGYDGLRQRTREIPEPGGRQVLVKMRACSLNYRDLKIVRGTYARNPDLPVVLLSDGAGEVVEAGPDVVRFGIGDRAMPIYMSGWHAGPLAGRHAGWRALGGDVDGTATEFAVLHEDDVVPVPDMLSYQEAACIPCAGVTAWHGLVSVGHVKAGDTVLVMGSGGVSLFGLQIAKMSGARVVATSSDDGKLKRLMDLGAWAGVNYRRTPNWAEKILELTGGRGVDHVLEVGGGETIGQSVRATRDAGHIALVGNLTGAFGTAEATERDIRMTRVTVGSREMTEDLLRAVALHKKSPVIDKTFSFDKLKSALAYLERGQHFGKVVVTF